MAPNEERPAGSGWRGYLLVKLVTCVSEYSSTTFSATLMLRLPHLEQCAAGGSHGKGMP
jgi:hypothetical protein